MTNKQIPPKLLIINDMAGVGRCSMAVALPVVSCCKVQACPIPTAIFSNHTGFETHYSVDLSSHLPQFLSHLNLLPVSFDGICCGFLNSTEQIEQLKAYFSTLKKEIPIFFDPVMGDHGKAYKTVTLAFIESLKAMLPFTALITPNLTEACLLTDTNYSPDPTDEALVKICQKLQAMGASKIVITGIERKDSVINAIFESSLSLIEQKKITPSRPGTGDIFISIVSALLLREFSLEKAVDTASDFIYQCLEISKDIPSVEGAAIENCLYLLTNL